MSATAVPSTRCPGEKLLIVIQKMISDPEFSYAPEPENVMKIYSFMHKVGALKNMPSTWQDLFFPEAHALKGN